MKSKILITGGNGQLATCLKERDSKLDGFEFLYTDYDDLDITDFHHLRNFFKENSIQWCVNCAAYTAVDKAETDKDLAFRINHIGAENLARICHEFRVKLIHVSTDFVFDGHSSTPYSENMKPNPLGVYGQSKLEGEKAIRKTVNQHFIVRTSWLYSEHGHNFMNTMLRLAENHGEIKVVADQIGTPTYGGDLADFMLKIISNNSESFGLYHYSNEGVASWYDFAKAIFDISRSKVSVKPIFTEEYPTPAERPKFSIMDKRKVKTQFDIELPYWRESLRKALNNNQ